MVQMTITETKESSTCHHMDRGERVQIVIRETKGSSCHHIDKRERVQIAMTETGIAAKPYPKVLHVIIYESYITFLSV